MNHLLYILPELFGVSIEVYVILLIIGSSTFFFWRWLFKKLILNDKKTRIIATWITTIAVAPIIYFLIVLIFVFSSLYYPSHDFNKQKWISDTEKRYELSEDIIESKILIGKTKSQVEEMLGKSDGWTEEDIWCYYLGYKPSLFGIDPDYLKIEFKNNKVVKVSQYES
jgi:hypothetical protein